MIHWLMDDELMTLWDVVSKDRPLQVENVQSAVLVVAQAQMKK